MLPILILFIASLTPESSNLLFRKPAGCDFFSRQNAEKILTTEVSWTGTDATEGEPKKWTCTFIPKQNSEGPKLYFGLHRFTTVENARGEFEAIVASNKGHKGFEKLEGIGDDAIVHTDGSNFQLVIVRKGVRSFRIKVNPAGSTSIESVKAVAEDLVRKLDHITAE